MSAQSLLYLYVVSVALVALTGFVVCSVHAHLGREWNDPYIGMFVILSTCWPIAMAVVAIVGVVGGLGYLAHRGIGVVVRGLHE